MQGPVIPVSCIRAEPGRGFRVFGYHTLPLHLHFVISGVSLTSWTLTMAEGVQLVPAHAPCSSPSLRKAKRGAFGGQIPPAAHPPRYIHVPGLNLKAWIQSGSPTPAPLRGVDALSTFPSPRCAPAERNNARCVSQRAPAGGFCQGCNINIPANLPTPTCPDCCRGKER